MGILIWLMFGIVSCLYMVRRDYRNGIRPQASDMWLKSFFALLGPLLTLALVIEWLGKRKSFDIKE